MNCDDGALNMLVRNPMIASSTKRRRYLRVEDSRSRPREISVRAAICV